MTRGQAVRGRYRLAGGGVEVWWTERRADRGQVEFRCRIERGAGADVETVRLVCDEELRPRGLYVAVHGAAGWRTLEALPRAAGWVAVVVAGPDGARRRHELPLPADAHVDYPALLLGTVALRRLALAPGEVREVPVLAVDAPSLVPAAGRRRYARDTDEPAVGRGWAGGVVGYTCTDVATGRVARLWAEPDGTVVAVEGLGEADREPEAG